MWSAVAAGIDRSIDNLFDQIVREYAAGEYLAEIADSLRDMTDPWKRLVNG